MLSGPIIYMFHSHRQIDMYVDITSHYWTRLQSHISTSIPIFRLFHLRFTNGIRVMVFAGAAASVRLTARPLIVTRRSLTSRCRRRSSSSRSSAPSTRTAVPGRVHSGNCRSVCKTYIHIHKLHMYSFFISFSL